jgi:hypothetical protein
LSTNDFAFAFSKLSSYNSAIENAKLSTISAAISATVSSTNETA